MFIFIVLTCALNLIISFFNARAVGKIWVETKAIGGMPRLLAWCGAVQSAVGFTSVYMVIGVFLMVQCGKFTEEDVKLFTDFLYVLLIIPAIGSGLVITIQSWRAFFLNRSLYSLGTAGWNTFAQGYNMYRAYNSFGPALESVLKIFSGGSGRRKKNTSAVILAIFVLMLGIITTTIIVRRYSGTAVLPKKLKAKLRDSLNEIDSGSEGNAALS